MTPGAKLAIMSAFSPYRLQNNAAIYDFTRLSSLIVDGSNRTSLAADLSGNSNVNVLALNAAGGNYASALNAAPLQVQGDLSIVTRTMFFDLTTQGAFQSKRTAGQWTYQFVFVPASNLVQFVVTTDGSTALTYNSDAWVGGTISALTWYWWRCDRRKSDGRIQFFYAGDTGNPNVLPSTWNKIGADRTGTTLDLFNGIAPVEIGSNRAGTGNLFNGLISRSILYSDLSGTVALDANFSTFSKLASTGTESSTNAATVTINSSGDTGARICGARDLVQLTVANQLVLQAGGGLLGNGTSQYGRSAAFSQVQPGTIYIVFQSVTWTDVDTIYDGGTLSSMTLSQRGVTPQLKLYAGTADDCTVSPTLQTNYVVTSGFNGASSFNRLNRNLAVTGNPGAGLDAAGFTLGAKGGAASNFSNILVREVIIRNVADSTATQDRIIQFLMRKHNIIG